MPNARSILTSRWLFNALLIAIVLALYAASINFGLIWDDPKWYQQGAGQSLGQLFTSLDTYQFYRPLAIGLNRLLVSPTGIVNAPLAHLIQIAAHLIATLAIVPLLRAFKIDERAARVSAILFAIYPLSYQAVAWQAPQQPIAMLAVFVALLMAGRFMQRDQLRYLSASLAVYAFGLLFQESALPFVAGFYWLAYLNRHATRQVSVRAERGISDPASHVACRARDSSSQKHAPRNDTDRHGHLGMTRDLKRWWPMLHLVLALGYFIIWLNVPRQAGVTGRGLQLNVLAYGLQAIAFPIANLFSGALLDVPVASLAIGFAAITLLLLVGAWRARGWRTGLFSGAWIAAGLLPIVVGLSWSYVRIGSRLLYPASLGIALLWGSCIAGLWTRRLWQRVLSIGLAAIVIAISIGQWSQFQRLYLMGTHYLDRTIELLANSPDQNLLFINYPDRIELLPSPYPLGNWGLILAPVVQNLSDYAAAKVGTIGASDQSFSALQVGAAERGVWPYEVFMRGEDTPSEKLVEVATKVDRVVVTDYLPDGHLRLREVGAIRSSGAASSTVAMFDEAVRLSEAQLATGDEVTLTLVWQVLAPLREGDTVFVHHWKDGAFVSAYDGDSLGGLIPLAAWRVGNDIIDVRHLAIPNFDPAHDELRVGLYNRMDGARYPAFDAQNQRRPDGAVPVARTKPY